MIASWAIDTCSVAFAHPKAIVAAFAKLIACTTEDGVERSQSGSRGHAQMSLWTSPAFLLFRSPSAAILDSCLNAFYFFFSA
jgi:hypothetical protein